MKYDEGYRSADVEDRRARGGGGRRGLKLGTAGTIIGIIVFFAFGKDYLGVMTSTGAGSGQATSGGAAPPSAEEEKKVALLSTALDDLQVMWTREFSEAGRSYDKAKLVLFRGQVDTNGCGVQGADVGPFYCPADKKAYIDLSFYDALAKRFGAPGDFAQAYVLAHEIGHHVQNLLGTNARVARLSQQNPGEKNALSVRAELQADCYAGVWAFHAKHLLEPGDIREALDAAAAIGDDTLQKKAGRRVSPESFTHGTSEQRARWFGVGYAGGDMDACDTFSAARL